jgi:hypothetical protein
LEERYALLRFASTLFDEWRDLLFARVTLSTVSAYARKTFAHLHALGPRFDARRQVGSLLPDIDRGTSCIAFLAGVGLFTIVPTLVEIGLVLVVMLRRYPVTPSSSSRRSSCTRASRLCSRRAASSTSGVGTHADLLRRKGVYARLWLLQQRQDQDLRAAQRR